MVSFHMYKDLPSPNWIINSGRLYSYYPQEPFITQCIALYEVGVKQTGAQEWEGTREGYILRLFKPLLLAQKI